MLHSLDFAPIEAMQHAGEWEALGEVPADSARRLEERFGLIVLVPGPEERAEVHRVIDEELCLGEIRRPSKAASLDIIDGIAAQGAEGIIFGGTEIGLLLKVDEVRVPVFDTTVIHAEAAVERLLGGG